MTAQSETHSEHSAASGGGTPGGGDRGGHAGTNEAGNEAADDVLLLAALLDGMETALCAFDADGVVTHWNREAQHILGWTPQEAVGRRGLAGWAVRAADADGVEERLLGAMHARGRQVHEFALLTKDGGRVLVRVQTSGVRGPDGEPAGVYCAFSEVHTQIDLERSIALSEALFEDAPWGVVLVDADLRPALANAHAARALGVGRTALLGRPLGELVDQGLEELENALQHVLAEGTTPSLTELWVTLPARDGRPGSPARDGGGTPGWESAARGGREPGAVEPSAGRTAGPTAGQDTEGGAGREAVRRCWRSGFLLLGSPLAQEPVPLGVAWVFRDVTDAKRTEQEASRLRFRDSQLHRAARAAAECEDPMEAAVAHLDFALAGFADHALVDLVVGRHSAGGVGGDTDHPDPWDVDDGPVRLVRATATPMASPGPCTSVVTDAEDGIPVPYRPGHPALQAVERCCSVRASVGGSAVPGWAAARKWPEEARHALCAVLRSRGRTLGVVTFLRSAGRRGFDRADAAYAEDVAVRVAAAVDLARSLRKR